ncbi:TAPT1-like protein [Ceratobasidium sp. AG-Ba]|nr:TAPT1-like protein [Ceratobasidium sp. AG-Ba]
MPGTRRPVSPLRRITSGTLENRKPRARRSTSSATSSQSASNPDYGRFTPLASHTQSSKASDQSARYYPTPSPPPALERSQRPGPVNLPPPSILSEERKTYASLPSTPVLSSSLPDFSKKSPLPERKDSVESDDGEEPFSLWDYLREELLATDFDSHQELKWERLISLNVTINAYDNALLTLLISNQFVEIKGSVFKKFEKDNLFQITCADIVERFQLSLMLLAVALRNLIELSSSGFDVDNLVLPKSFRSLKVNFLSGMGGGAIWAIFSPVMTVLMSELIVDWLKHAFITKFNHIRPSVYERYTDVLCRDLLASGSGRSSRKQSYVDQSPLVARRLGLPTLPLAVLVMLIGAQSAQLALAVHGSTWSWSWTWIRAAQCAVVGLLAWFCLVTIKIMLGVNLLAYAIGRKKGMDARIQADEDVNKFGRNPIGEGKEEQVYNRELKTVLSHAADDVPPISELGGGAKKSEGGGGGTRKKVALEDLTRFTMVKRIW